ncbi:LAETG motif-containing sortase-dependent surface protein [Streptomyces sp. NPDC057424]|uniref:LAETG motif-containing sortase-dependent surface protein n=1 Tax=Streptomyces sp. NPDC057424 TaxID=3346127 RepID=UPI00369BEB42
MKLRRAMAAAAATAVIAPVALLAAPAAYATDETTPTPSASVSESAPETSSSPSVSESAPESTPAPSTSASESAPETSSSPSASASESSPAPSASEPEEPEESESPDPEPSVCEDTKVDVGISGLSGKIAAGSGWHKFSLNVVNNSDSTLNDLDFFAGASPDKNGEELFSSKQVQLQAWDPQDKIWVDLNEGGYAVGYVGYTDELKPDYEVNIPLRLNVKPSAPVGSGFSLGATIYGDSDGECVGFGDVSYKFQIVSSGTDTEGTKPQEGGKAPVTDEKPSGNTPEVTGSLAETGSSSALPMISLVGGAAVVAGAGAIFVVRRRKAGVEA